uniref:Glucose-methanol-choline oxidoreductase C-terminal domain-containing protein n=1 Tax=viral metagenome TaxID=1070528 RepID=A0A6C0C6U0_9ZZZZ
MKEVANAAGEFVIFPPASDYPSPFGPAPDDSLLLADAKNNANLAIQSHITGTTRMATSISEGVVNGDLDVFGLKNIKICNLGVAPVPPDGNPCLATYYIAMNLANKLGAL